MFSDCSGECCICHNADYCVAGHGDDEYESADMNQVLERLRDGKFPSYRACMVKHLYTRYGHIWKAEDLDTANAVIEALLEDLSYTEYLMKTGMRVDRVDSGVREPATNTGLYTVSARDMVDYVTRVTQEDIDLMKSVYEQAKLIQGIDNRAKSDGGER